MINYNARHKVQGFMDFKNPAKAAMLFLDYEYNAGGEPMYRSTEEKVRTSGGRFVKERKYAQTRARVRRMLKARREGTKGEGRTVRGAIMRKDRHPFLRRTGKGQVNSLTRFGAAK